MTDLTDDEIVALTFGPEKQSLLAQQLLAAMGRVAELEARLEIDREYKAGEDGTLQLVAIPSDQRANQIDGIESRDATIAELQRQLATARAETWDAVDALCEAHLSYYANGGVNQSATGINERMGAAVRSVQASARIKAKESRG